MGPGVKLVQTFHPVHDPEMRDIKFIGLFQRVLNCVNICDLRPGYLQDETRPDRQLCWLFCLGRM